MFRTKSLFLAVILIVLSFNCFAANTKDFVFKQGNLAIFAPPVINKNYFLFEFGFVTEKKIKSWNYDYNAFVTAALFEDWLGKTDNLRAGGLGFKAGVILPTQHWVPLLATLSVGYAKTVLNKNPVFGQESANLSKKDMFLLEAGALYRFNNYFLRFAYQRSNVGYFSRHSILMMGVTY
jgi:hypothetical protein